MAAIGRREAQRTRMRARLLEAAIALFAEQGYDATTIDQIAEKADVARQTVLNHYPHKRDFPQAWARQRRDSLLELSERAAENERARDQLHRYFAALATMNERERELTRMLYVSQRYDELMVHQRPVSDAVVEAIERGSQRGEFDPAMPAHAAAEVITAVYFDTLSRWLVLPEAPFDLSTALTAKLDLVITGLEVR